MRFGSFHICLFSWILLATASIPNASFAATTEEIARAIKQLGASEHKQRETASMFLWSAGPAAMPALDLASKSSDPEIALRAREILTNLQYKIGPDTPPDIRELLRQYHNANPEGRKTVVSQLMDLGARAYPTLTALAESEPLLERRVEIFRPALEQITGHIEQVLGGERPDAEQLAEALRSIRLFQAVVPEDLSIPLQVVTRLDKLGKNKEADEIFEAAFAFHQKLCAKSAQDPNPANDLAWLCAVCRRRLDEALDLSQKAVALEPKNPAYLDTLAEIHFQKRNRERAIELMKQCIELSPDNDYFRKQRDRFEKSDPATPPPKPE
jgi:tetratricopeptide (TPR) repeat protein